MKFNLNYSLLFFYSVPKNIFPYPDALGIPPWMQNVYDAKKKKT